MASRTINIKLKTVFDAAGAKAAAKAMAGIGTSARGAGTQTTQASGSGARGLDGLAASAAKADRQILAMANALAKHARATGDGAKEVQILTSALARVDQTSVQAISTMTRLAQAQQRLGAESTRTAGSMAVLPRTIAGLSHEAANFARSAIGFTTVGAAVTVMGGALSSAVGTAANFEQSMANLGAVSNATAADMRALEEAAKIAGSTTKFTATEAADGLTFLAMAGYDSQQAIAALPGVLNLAAAANIGLAQSADIVSNILSGFGLQAEQTGMLVDVMAKAAAASNTSIPQLGLAMTYVAPIAAELGQSIQSTTAAIGKLSDAGIQGEKAGTALRAIFISLAAPTATASAHLERLGIAVQNSSGQMLGLPEILGNIAAATDSLTNTERIEIFADLVGREAASALANLVANREGVASLTAELQNAGGAAEQMAQRQLATLQGQMTLFMSAVDGVALSIGNLFIPALTNVVANGLTPFVAALQESLTYVEQLGQMTNGLAGTVAESGASYQEYMNQVNAANAEFADFAAQDPIAAMALSWLGVASAVEPLPPLAYEAAAALRENGASAEEVAAAMDGLGPVVGAYADALGMAQSQGAGTAAIVQELEGAIYGQATASEGGRTAVLGLIAAFREGDITAQQLRSGMDVLSAAEMQLGSATDATRSQVIAAIQAFAEKRITSAELISILENLRTVEELVAGATQEATAATDDDSAAKEANTGATDTLTAALEDERIAKSLAAVESQILAAREQELFAAAQAAASGSGSLQSAAASLAAQFGVSEGEARRLIAALRELAAIGGVSQKGGAPGGYQSVKETGNTITGGVSAARLAAVASTGRGGGGGGGGSARGGGAADTAAKQVKAAEQTAAKLADIQAQASAKIVSINEAAAAKLVEIDRQAADERARIAQQLADTIASSAASSAFEREANDLELVGETDEKRIKALQARERAEAEAADRSAALAEETLAQIAAGEVDAAEANYETQTKAIDSRQQLDEDYYTRQAELAGNPEALAELDKQYQEAITALEQRTATELAIEQAKIDAKKQALEEEKAAVIQNAQEQTDAVVSAAQDQAAKVAGASAEQTAAVSAALAAQSTAASNWASAIASAADRAVAAAQRAAAAIAAIPSPSAGGGGGSGGGSGGPEARAMGGPVRRGQPYIVGERGPELIVPDGNGTVLTAPETQRLIRGAQQAAQSATATAAPAASGGKRGSGGGGGGGDDAPTSATSSMATGILEQAAVLSEAEAEALDRYQKSLDSVLKTLESLEQLSTAAAAYELAGPIDPMVVEGLAADARFVVNLVIQNLIPITEEEGKSLDRYFSVASDSIGILQDLNDLRNELRTPQAPIPIEYIRKLAEDSRLISGEVGRYLANPPSEALAILYRYQDAVERSVGLLNSVADLRNTLSQQPSPIPVEYIRKLSEDARLIGGEVGRYFADPTEQALVVLGRYQTAVESSVRILADVADLRSQLSDRPSPIPIEYIRKLSEDARLIGGEVGRYFADPTESALVILERYQAAVESSVAILTDVADLRNELTDKPGPIPLAYIRSLAEEARAIGKEIARTFADPTENALAILQRYQAAVESSVGILTEVAALRRETEGLSGPIPLQTIYSLADEAKRIVDILRGRILVRNQGQVDALTLYEDFAERSINILNAVADLRRNAVDLPGPIPIQTLYSLADEAKRVVDILRGRILLRTQDQVDALTLYETAAMSSIGILSAVADLRRNASDMGPPLDAATITRLADDAKRITETVRSRLVPVTEEQAAQLQRYDTAANASVSALRSVLDLSGNLFADYISPSDAQLNLLATDAKRVVDAVERAARVYSTEGLEKANLYADTVGNTFEAFKGGLLFFDALRSGDFTLDTGKLAAFEKATASTLATLNRLGAQAATIPQGNLAALQSATSALSGQAEALIRLAAVPFDNLPALSGAFGGVSGSGGGGGGSTSITFGPDSIAVYAAPGMNETALAQQVATQAISMINQQLRTRL